MSQDLPCHKTCHLTRLDVTRRISHDLPDASHMTCHAHSCHINHCNGTRLLIAHESTRVARTQTANRRGLACRPTVCASARSYLPPVAPPPSSPPSHDLEKPPLVPAYWNEKALIGMRRGGTAGGVGESGQLQVKSRCNERRRGVTREGEV